MHLHVAQVLSSLSRPRALRPAVKMQPCRALEIDFADPDTWVGIIAAVGGLGAGLGFLIFSENRIDEDEKSLEDLRKLNRETFKETGQYLSKEEIEAIRTPKWTDRREFVDDD